MNTLTVREFRKELFENDFSVSFNGTTLDNKNARRFFFDRKDQDQALFIFEGEGVLHVFDTFPKEFLAKSVAQEISFTYEWSGDCDHETAEEYTALLNRTDLANYISPEHISNAIEVVKEREQLLTVENLCDAIADLLAWSLEYALGADLDGCDSVTFVHES